MDLSGVTVVDAHYHNVEEKGLLAYDPDSWLERTTLMGMPRLIAEH